MTFCHTHPDPLIAWVLLFLKHGLPITSIMNYRNISRAQLRKIAIQKKLQLLQRKIGAIELAKLVEKVVAPTKGTAIVQTGTGNKRTTDTNSDFTELSIASNIVDTPQDIGRLVQYPLSILGYKPGPIDQQLGPKTQIAIRAFQADSNLAVTGQSDKQLVIELMGAMLKHWSSETDTRSHFRF